VTPAALDNTYGRLRTPVQGPDGALYVTTANGSNDRILRVEVVN
jgi:glucose/arabinose dehydrogenase